MNAVAGSIQCQFEEHGRSILLRHKEIQKIDVEVSQACLDDTCLTEPSKV